MKCGHINTQARSPDLEPGSLKSLEACFDLSFWSVEQGYTLEGAQQPQFLLLDDILALMWESGMARSLINFAAKKNWLLDLGPLEEGAYNLDPEARLLSLNSHHLGLHIFEKPGFFRHGLMLTLIKGLRDIWHFECRQPYPKGLSLESYLFLERVRAADCDVITLLAAWELRCEGVPELWRHLIGAPEGDMAMRFLSALERTPRKLFDHSALIEAFHQWFEGDARVAACDHLTLEMIDDALDSHTAHHRFNGQVKVAPSFIESLSRLPDKRYYLHGYGVSILDDPHFAGLDDEVNQAHFLQIKADLESVACGSVRFRDSALAAKIFPMNE